MYIRKELFEYVFALMWNRYDFDKPQPEGLVTDEEVALLLEENTSRNPEFLYYDYRCFDLKKWKSPKNLPT